MPDMSDGTSFPNEYRQYTTPKDSTPKPEDTVNLIDQHNQAVAKGLYHPPKPLVDELQQSEHSIREDKS